jgi:short-subunit dehydrogenase
MPRPLALVTGASSGIGQAFATQLAASGHDLIVVARRRERLEALAQQLGAAHGAKVEVLIADLSTSAGVDAVAKRAAEAPLELLVNNAGIAAYRSFLELDPKIADDLLSVLIRAVVQVTRAALPGMVARRRGGVINVASLLALSGSVNAPYLPRRAVYAGSKAFVLAFTQLLAGELAETGVRIQVCLPGVVKTEFHEVQGMDLSDVPRMSADDVARGALAGLARGEVVCVPAMENPEALGAVSQAQQAVFASSRTTTLAARYRTPEG